MSPKGLFVKALFLSLSLVLVVWSMGRLRHQGLSPGLQTALSLPGADRGTGEKTTGQRAHIEFCDTRITRISRPGKDTLVQEGLKWFRGGDTLSELNFVAVEKWFAHLCRKVVAFHVPAPIEPAQASVAAVITYVRGGEITLHQGPTPHRYSWQGIQFESSDLTEMLAEIDALPQRSRPASVKRR